MNWTWGGQLTSLLQSFAAMVWGGTPMAAVRTSYRIYSDRYISSAISFSFISSSMSAPHLDIDDEDFGWDIVPAIEQSFGIRFEQHDFEHVRTYAELCGMIQNKLPQNISSTCTTQQAFYKLRLAMQPHTADSLFSPDSQLTDFLPAQPAQRRQAARNIEETLGMKLAIVGGHPTVQSILIITLLLAFPGLLVGAIVGHITGSWIGVQMSLICFTASIIGMHIAIHFGTSIQYGTVREVAKAMSSRYYRQSRRHPDSVNPREFLPQINELFSHMTGIDADGLTPDAILR